MKNICFLSSSGGHLEQLIMLKPIMQKNNSFIVTEEGEHTQRLGERSYYLKQINRREISFLPKMILNTIKSLSIYIKEKPQIIICTGALSTVPFCLLSKLFNSKLIFIESFAKVYTGSLTGRFLYLFADEFYVQWEEMLEIYPKAKFKGGIY